MESRPITTQKPDMVTLIQRFRLKLQIEEPNDNRKNAVRHGLRTR